jgi:hypothetical protein
MTSKEYLSKSHQEFIIRKIKESFKIIECDHKFYAYGLGYKCDCGVYTGTNSELNSIIKRELEDSKNLTSHNNDSVVTDYITQATRP